jgi:hypothetical protein
MFNKLRNLFAILGLLGFLVFAGYYSYVTYQQARAGAAVYVWLNSSPAKGQPLRLETLEKLINAPNP